MLISASQKIRKVCAVGRRNSVRRAQAERREKGGRRCSVSARESTGDQVSFLIATSLSMETKLPGLGSNACALADSLERLM